MIESIKKRLPILIVLLVIFGCTSPKKDLRLLIFSKTAGFRHGSIETGIETISTMAKKDGYIVEQTEDAAIFTEENLKGYSAVIFLNTTGDVLNNYQQADFERYIQAGGGFVGIHSATDTEYDWQWYGKLIGAYFKGHPHVQEAELVKTENKHISTDHIGDSFNFTDEWYNFKNISKDITPILLLNEKSYTGGQNGDYHPASWYQEFDGGRSFYTVLGHRNETFRDSLVLNHIKGAIKYAVGNNKLDYSLAKSVQPPAENRFVRSILLQNLYEPMELDVLDKENLIFIQRNGGIFTYNTVSNEKTKVMDFPVNSNLEDGLLGMAVDPNYKSNKWIYLYYSPQTEEPIQRISRFDFDGKTLDMSSEKIVLVVDVQRDQCCHSAGSLEFGPDGLLYLSTGDNTNPFASSGYAPIDERPGRSPWDAQKSSANTNDLRGKILRIRPLPDGTYEIPEGNLFPEGTPNTRPEIYVMGLRNPFRISIDSKRNWLYWGDVGPDAGGNNETRGPKGLDELNQSRAAGFWGWPYSRGNNQPYHDFDFATNTAGDTFNVNKPINDSPNNTGLKELPPINKSLVWYSYDKSKEFPWVGVGGKNPMAGPIYYSDKYAGAGNRFPDYFDGKIFFYEWMRDWIYIVTLDENGDYFKAEPFMGNSDFHNPVDMVFGEDGSLYILEYGEKWKAQNLDARLNKIEYVSGNRAPVARMEVDKTVGSIPLTVVFSAEKSEDFDGDKLKYSWNFTGSDGQSNESEASYTFEKSGTYDVELTVTDNAGKNSTISRKIFAGNAPPEVSIELDTDNTFYWDNKKVAYKVIVKDNEDGSNVSGAIKADDIKVSLTYLNEGEDLAEVTLGHQQTSKPKGLTLIEGSDCKACHALAEKVNGPSYTMVAAKYTDKDVDYLAQRVITGGSGTWGENMMSAHPQLKIEDVKEMVSYILSTGEKKIKTENVIPASGDIVFDQHINKDGIGKYVLLATYKDKGGENVESLSAESMITFIPPIRQAEKNDGMSDQINVWNAGGSVNLSMIQNGVFVKFNSISGNNLKDIMLRNFYVANYSYEGTVEVHLDKKDGKLLGSKDISSNLKKEAHKEFVIDIDSFDGVHDVYFVFKNAKKPKQYIANLDWFYFRYQDEKM